MAKQTKLEQEIERELAEQGMLAMVVNAKPKALTATEAEQLRREISALRVREFKEILAASHADMAKQRWKEPPRHGQEL